MRKKRLRFAALDTMDNVIDDRRSAPGWFDRTFGRDGAVVLELGCGHGDHTLALARSRPDLGVIGVDRNGARLWKGAERAREEGLTNLVFLRAEVERLTSHVPPGRVRALWLLFPDPLPKTRQAKHRLSAPRFLVYYRRLLAPGGTVHLKTDSLTLVASAEAAVRRAGGRVIARSDSPPDDPSAATSIQSTYERRYRTAGRTIHSRTFSLERAASSIGERTAHDRAPRPSTSCVFS